MDQSSPKLYRAGFQEFTNPGFAWRTAQVIVGPGRQASYDEELAEEKKRHTRSQDPGSRPE